MNKAERVLVERLLKAFKTGRCKDCPMLEAAEAALSAAVRSMAESGHDK